MAGVNGSESATSVDAATDRRWQLAYRSDLSDAFGIVLTVPEHGQDSHGNWRYGLRSIGGLANQEIEAEFESEMRELIARSAPGLVSRRLLTQQEAEAIQVHSYSVGPAAQEWPEFFVDLYQDARPILLDGEAILGWAYFIRDLVRSIRSWAMQKDREQPESPDAEAVEYSSTGAMPSIALTRPAIVALCYTDLFERHAVTQDVVVETFPRTPTEFATVDHPAGLESYPIRARVGRRNYFYQVSGRGVFSEHFLLIGSTLTPLPLPDFLPEVTTQLPSRPLPSQRITIKGN